MYWPRCNTFTMSKYTTYTSTGFIYNMENIIPKKKIALMKFCRSIGELSGIERQVFRALDLILFKTLVAFQNKRLVISWSYKFFHYIQYERIQNPNFFQNLKRYTGDSQLIRKGDFRITKEYIANRKLCIRNILRHCNYEIS